MPVVEERTAREVRCWRCDKLLANSAREYNITCPRCHATNQGA